MMNTEKLIAQLRTARYSHEVSIEMLRNAADSMEAMQGSGDIRALKYRIHELEGEVIGYKRILDDQAKAVPVAIAHVGNMDHGPFEITPTAHGCDHLKHGDNLYTQAAVEPMKDLNDLLVGMLVSMDVSTGEHDAYHRVFGTVCEVMLQSCGAAEDTILAIEDSRNFQAPVEDLK